MARALRVTVGTFSPEGEVLGRNVDDLAGSTDLAAYIQSSARTLGDAAGAVDVVSLIRTSARAVADFAPADDDAAGVGFLDDVTRPVFRGTGNTANNVGCLAGVTRTAVSALPGGQAAGKLHQNLTISTQVVVTSPDQTFRNCRFTYSYVGDGNGGMVDMRGSAMIGQTTRFEFCEFEPTTPNDRFNGIYGHDFVAYRCAFLKVVDGTGAYNQYGPDCNVELACNWMGWPAWVADDYTPNRPGGHSDLTGTHNDVSTQHGAGWYVNVHGNFINCVKYNIKNPGNIVLTSDWQGYTVNTGNGIDVMTETASPSHWRPQCGSAFLSQHSAYYVVDQLRFCNNWIWNFGDAGFKLAGAKSSGVKAHDGTTPGGTRYYINNVEFTDNVFGGKPRSWGSTTPYMPVRFDTNCFVNGRDFRGPTSGQQYPFDVDGNVWDPGTVLQGSTSYNAAQGSQPILSNPIRYVVDGLPLP